MMMIFLIHSCSDGAQRERNRVQRWSVTARRGDGSRADRLATCQKVALRVQLARRFFLFTLPPMSHYLLSLLDSPSPTPSTGAPLPPRSRPRQATVQRYRRPICPLLPSVCQVRESCRPEPPHNERLSRCHQSPNFLVQTHACPGVGLAQLVIHFIRFHEEEP